MIGKPGAAQAGVPVPHESHWDEPRKSFKPWDEGGGYPPRLSSGLVRSFLTMANKNRPKREVKKPKKKKTV